MPRFFFHVRDGELLIEDVEGIEIPYISDIKSRLFEAATEVLSEEEWRAERIEGRIFEIVDENGHTMLIVPFRNRE